MSHAYKLDICIKTYSGVQKDEKSSMILISSGYYRSFVAACSKSGRGFLFLPCKGMPRSLTARLKMDKERMPSVR